MKKFFFFIILFFLFVAAKAQSFWPFEKTWENNPDWRQITYNDGGFDYSLQTKAKTVGDFLAENKIKLSSDDLVFPAKDAELATGSAVIIKRPLNINIKVDGKEINAKVFSTNVEEAITAAGVTVSHLDKIEPEKKTALENGMKIAITRINVEEVAELEPIEFETIEKDDPKLKWKKQRVDQEGEAGEKEVKYKITYTNGKQSSKVKLASSVIKKPTPKIIYNGTKIEVGKITRGRASWYAYTGTMACASLQFPKGTWLRVSNPATGKQVIVQVNDSGPYAPDKIIDLDKIAFQKLGDLGAGVMNVKVEEILE